MQLIQLVEAHRPFDAHEAAMTQRLRAFLQKGHEATFGRELAGDGPDWGHVTGSAWVVNAHYSRVVLVHHAKLGKWVQPGGHCEGESDVLNVAMREAMEETGLRVEPHRSGIFDIDVHLIPEYWRTPAHCHYDVRFLLRANSDHEPHVSDESHAVRWVTLEEAAALSGEASIERMIAKTRILAEES